MMKRVATLAAVVFLGVVVQIALVIADTQDSPYKAVAEFSTAYFKIDPAMSNRLCNEIMESNHINPVEDYVWSKKEEARLRGFNLGYLKSKLAHVVVNIEQKDNNSATAELKATRKFPIRSFFTGETYEVHEELELIKEDGKWKVCGNPFGLVS